MSKAQTLEKWLPKPKSNKSRIVIFDFDNTIFNSLNREQGETVYFEATGKMLPFPGWWGRMESMSPPIVPEIPGPEWYIPETLAGYKEDAKDPNADLVLMTGRPFKHRKRVIFLCQNQGMEFHHHYFRGQPNQRGRDTFEIKTNFIQDDLIHPELKILEIWEDRPEHTSAFMDLAKKWKSKYRNHLEQVIIHDVLLKTTLEF
jgi:hypothetical protein